MIGDQCWMAENLNIGYHINGIDTMSNNDTIEKYCYNNNPSKCDQYGGLYQWNETMQYSNDPGVQGICPPGWHVPSDDEWKVLEGNVDSEFGVGANEWNDIECRGFDAGYNLKATYGWQDGPGSDAYNFTALAAGIRSLNGAYTQEYQETYFWTSSKFTGYPWSRYLVTYSMKSCRYFVYKELGFSVRCIKNDFD